MQDGHRLHLLRHAKSSWDDDSLPDVERPLAPRGRKAASALRKHFEATKLQVDLVLCSPARRTRETWDEVQAGMRTGEVRFVPAVYDAGTAALLEVLRAIDNVAGAVLLLGHNPGLADLVDYLVADGRPEAMARLRDGFPTGGFATLRLDTTWPAVERRGGFLEDFVRPKDLRQP